MVRNVKLVVKCFHLGNYIYLIVFGDDSIEIIFTKLFSSVYLEFFTNTR